ncbi:MAG: HypC/HybG/HupF family hydrogenase formation chaperone [candidate division WOR-3 bacterium]
MCLGIPMRLLEKEGDEGWVESGGLRRRVSLALVPNAEPGQWVIVHAGFAIETLSEEEALETLDMLREALGGE